jgi:hypothetical protein
MGNGENLQARCPSALVNRAHTADTRDVTVDQAIAQKD